MSDLTKKMILDGKKVVRENKLKAFFLILPKIKIMQTSVYAGLLFDN